MAALVLLVVVGSTIWMGMDASGRDWSENKFARHTWQWVVGGSASGS
jgi:heme/copper-type cytochrome/quinol oxidase subunit 1